MKSILYNYLTVLIVVVSAAENCNLARFSVKYGDRLQHNLIQSFNDCLVPENFDHKGIRTIIIENENISTIPAHFIEKHEELYNIGISNSGIQSILPGAFRNLPQLHTLAIRGNNFSSLFKGTFVFITPSLFVFSL